MASLLVVVVGEDAVPPALHGISVGVLAIAPVPPAASERGGAKGDLFADLIGLPLKYELESGT